MKLNEYISTIEDRQNWKEHLMLYSKDELAELILDRMVRDSNYSQEIHCKLTSRTEYTDYTEDTDIIISSYEMAVEKEMNKKVPDVDFLELLSEKVLESVAITDSLFEQLRMYASVIIILDKAVNDGAGFEEENEFVLLEVMDYCYDQMIFEIEGKHEALSAEELGQVYELMEGESKRYDPLDVHNRIEDAFYKLLTLTKGRTRVDKNDAYVRIRGSEYYKNF